MNDPIFFSHVTKAVHEDRISALRRSRHSRASTSRGIVRSGLYRSLLSRRAAPRRVECRA
jgi:hypothetical protein